jgi:single-strand DNA-binding protein
LNKNLVVLIGRLGQDPEVKYLGNGDNTTPVASFSIGTSESYKPKDSDEWVENTEWHNIVAWRYLAEKTEKSLEKGNLVAIEGKLTHRSWEKDGKTHYRTEIVASKIDLMQKRTKGANQEEAPVSNGKGKGKEVVTNTTKEGDDLPF